LSVILRHGRRRNWVGIYTLWPFCSWNTNDCNISRSK